MNYEGLVAFAGSERQAHFLAEQLDYRNMTEQQLFNQVIRLVIHVKK